MITAVASEASAPVAAARSAGREIAVSARCS
jgi:hypothetical protein